MTNSVQSATIRLGLRRVQDDQSGELYEAYSLKTGAAVSLPFHVYGNLLPKPKSKPRDKA